jgi:uncharacterized protein (TIGR04255 family)
LEAQFLTKRLRYRKSPITEAVIDIRVSLRPEKTPESLLKLSDLISDSYGNRTDVQRLTGKFTLGASPTQEQTLLGYSYKSKDDKYVLQTRIDGFTFSRLQPYEHWEPFREEAYRLWSIFRKYADPIQCTRAAVRYINQIDLPVPADLELYFRTFPQISRDMPQMMSGYVMQLLIPQPDFGGMLSLIQATVPASSSSSASIRLDIDLFKESQADFDTDEQIWAFLDSLRSKRDHIFESCITDRSRSLFEPLSM